MSDPGSLHAADVRQPAPVFLSYATTDRQQAMKVCDALERRGVPCWIALRDVPPGANYQEAIVQSLRSASALVLVFSPAANTSDEIKKELSLASRYRVPVIALRLEDVEPSDAFAYELSTRQWINVFEGWDKSIDVLVDRIRGLAGREVVQAASIPTPRNRPFIARHGMAIAAAGLLVLIAAGVTWWTKARPEVTPHSMVIRLEAFQLLSPDLPPTLRDTVSAEITAAFNVDGVVGVSTAAAPEPGSAPAYLLGGTIQRTGGKLRVITRMVNERSGAALWSDTFDYDGSELATLARHIAVDAGNVVRCGLFGASTYHEPLPDNVLRDYLQFCQGHWDPNLADGRKALIPAQRVVAAVPDFSWGWAAVAGAYWKVALNATTPEIADAARASGREAADRAVAIDSRNSEALYIKAVLLDPLDWIGREELFKRAVAARRLDCGCEYHQYGTMLVDVGRVGEALEYLHRADDMLALYVYTPWTLAEALVVAGKPEEARTYFDAAISLAPNRDFARYLTMVKATSLGDIDLLSDASLPMPQGTRAALLQGYRALASRDSAAKAQAVNNLTALPEAEQFSAVAKLLAELGATHEAFVVAKRLVTNPNYYGVSIFWDRGMRSTLSDPGFPELVENLGLVQYWRATRTRPDVCSEQDPPPFCQRI